MTEPMRISRGYTGVDSADTETAVFPDDKQKTSIIREIEWGLTYPESFIYQGARFWPPDAAINITKYEAYPRKLNDQMEFGFGTTAIANENINKEINFEWTISNINKLEWEKRLNKINLTRNILAYIAMLFFIAMVVFLSLSFANIWHWAVWIPGSVGAFGILVSNSIHIAKLDKMIDAYGK